jgi:hypothetical protein
LGLRMIVRDAGRDVCLLESAGNVHALRTLRGEDSPPRRRAPRGDAEKTEPRMSANEHRQDKAIHAKAPGGKGAET